VWSILLGIGSNEYDGDDAGTDQLVEIFDLKDQTAIRKQIAQFVGESKY
jgi:hypothetical protein